MIEAGQQPSNMENKSTKNLSDSDCDIFDLTEEPESFPKVEAGQQLSNMEKKVTENLSDSDSDLVDLYYEADMLKEGIKCFILLSGKTLNVDRNFIDHLQRQVPQLKMVDKVEECNFILVFCPVVSRAGTDIEAALKKLQNISETKPAVVVVLHHTFDPDYVVPDSSRSVQREETITVDFLFHEDQGLLQCTRNTESLATITNHLKHQVPTTSLNVPVSTNVQSCVSSLSKILLVPAIGCFSGFSTCPNFSWFTSRSSVSPEPITYEEIKISEKPGKEIKCFILSSGKTLNIDKSLIDHLKQVPQLKMVDKVEDCDFILVFCLVVSRAGTDIEAALQKLQNISDTKPAVLVTLHHTFDPDSVVPDSSRSVQRDKTITADFLFHEDQGLLQCTKNKESFTRIINHLFQAQNSGWFSSDVL
ncbi:uncharacterized protein LOC134303258 isoform X2 [Trichomycterus rosablanca]|uniref:uncharacterized protein LOC134303258 isoform X2 n=1 Tax=Trichomycterus rosablanca TaxID=2290929 RepID=UPI002F35B3D8